MADVSVLEVLLHGEPIGTLTHVGGDRTLFAFNESYIEDEQRPVLGLGFKDSLGQLLTEFRPVQTRVMPYFSNLLPEGHLRSYLSDRAGVKPEHEYFLLWALGRDLPGAIIVRPVDEDDWPPEDEDENAESVGETEEQRSENVLRFSLAGVQLKFSAVNEARGGLTIPAKGVGGSMIVKLPSRAFVGVPENEYSMLTLARMIGMDVPDVHLIDVDAIKNLPEGIGSIEGQALATERFDRMSDGFSVHIEDFAQVFDVYPERKYERASYRRIAAVLGAEGDDNEISEFIRRLTFNMLIGNADMHLKNWSVIYHDRHTASLAPAYDFVSTIPYIRENGAALSVSRTKRFDEFSLDELSHMAAKSHLPETLVLDTARETVALFHERWASEKRNLPLADHVVDTIDTHLLSVPIAQE